MIGTFSSRSHKDLARYRGKKTCAQHLRFTPGRLFAPSRKQPALCAAVVDRRVPTCHLSLRIMEGQIAYQTFVFRKCMNSKAGQYNQVLESRNCRSLIQQANIFTSGSGALETELRISAHSR